MKKERLNIAYLFARGDESAFRILYDDYASGLRYFVAKYIADPDQRNDVLQETFISLWRKRRDFDNVSSIKAYLYRVAQTSCLNILRHRNVEMNYAAAYRAEDEISTFLDNILETEIFNEVSEAFRELAPATKKVYELSLDGMRQKEIAELLDISINTIKKHKNNANHFLRRRLKNVF